METSEINNNYIASGANVVRIKDSIDIPPFETYKVELNLGETFQKDDIFQSWRGQIINNSLFTEELVENIISTLLFKVDSEQKKLFQSIILSKEFFGFMNKWKVLRDLLKTIEPYKNENYSGLLNDIHEIISIRDKFAHGQVSYAGSKGEKIILEYFNEIPRKDEITEKTIADFRNLIIKCRKELEGIIIKTKS